MCNRPINPLYKKFATDYIAQWLDKTAVGNDLKALQAACGQLTAKKVREFLDTNATKYGWDAKETRRWKRAAVLIIHQLQPNKTI